VRKGSVVTELDEAALMGQVDNREPGPTEPSEQEVLEDLYGPPDRYGIYRGDPR
jgi:hypothetical protein